jgi:hypothetical protein
MYKHQWKIALNVQHFICLLDAILGNSECINRHKYFLSTIKLTVTQCVPINFTKSITLTAFGVTCKRVFICRALLLSFYLQAAGEAR